MADEGSRPGRRAGGARRPGSEQARRIAELEADVRRLEAAVRERTAALVEARESIRQRRLQAEQAELELRRELDATRARLSRLTRNPLFRIALTGLRVVRRVRAAVATRWPIGRGGASRRAERELTRRLLGQLPNEAPTTGPRVAIVILNRDGVKHLRRLLPALEATAYRDIEIVLVDNASTDGSVAYARGFRTRHPLRIVENAENLSFSVANNLALHHSDAELLLFLNNDVLPMEQHWLGWMVESVMTDGTVACGARLITPKRRIPRSERAEVAQGDLELQHAGIQFAWIMGMPRPWNIGGPDPSAAGLGEIQERPAATAACLLVRRDAFLAAGAFDPAYVYGYEDVDLCLRLRARGGRILVDGRVVLWHDESSTRRRGNSKATRLRQRENRQTFHGRWGRSLFREVLRDRLDGRHFLSADPISCAIAVPAEAMGGDRPPAVAGLLREALTRTGWATQLLVVGSPDWPGTPEVVMVTDPRVDVRELSRDVVKIAWIEGSANKWVGTPWIDDYDLLLASDEGVVDATRRDTSHVARLVPPADGPIEVVADAIKAEFRAWVEARRVGILIQADDWERARTSGDYHFARGLQRQFERRGLPTTVYFRPAWNTPVSTRDDVAIHLWGRYPVGRRPGQTSLLWILYHPELVTDDLVAEYDMVLVASDEFARTIADRSNAPVVSLHQATDPERFRPGLPGPHHDLLFVGNSRGVRRPILDDLTPTRHDLAVYGGGWAPDLLDPAYLRGESVPNEELPGYYGSASIVLNDHWREAADVGFLNNRLYDASAAGGFVISDQVDGLQEEFDEGVVAYRDPADLIRLVDRYLADPAARAERAVRARRAVLDRHTFSHRADEILRLVERLEAPRPEAISEDRPQRASPVASVLGECDVCGARGSFDRFELREMLFGTRETFDYMRCPDCGVLRIVEIPADMSPYYPPDYYDFGANLEATPSPGFLTALADEVRKRYALFGTYRWLARLLRPWAPTPGVSRRQRLLVQHLGLRSFDDPVLDVGCGRRATRLLELKLLGFRSLLGVDPFLESDGEYEGIPVRRLAIHDVEGSFQAITFHHSFEHVPDPRATLAAAEARLRPGGTVLVRTPVFGSWFWETFGTAWWELDPPRHLYVHTRASLERLATDAGLELTHVEWDSAYPELIASTQIARDTAWREPASWNCTPPAGFDDETIERFKLKVAELNAAGVAGRAGFYFRRRGELDVVGRG